MNLTNTTNQAVKFSAKAKEIRTNYLNNKFDQNKINKQTIKKNTDNVKNNLSEYVLSDTERDKAKSEAISENTYDQQQCFSFSENLETLAREVKNILEDTAPKSISIPELDDDKVLFNWVQTGIKLHKDENRM